jgi:hypothetical protein
MAGVFPMNDWQGTITSVWSRFAEVLPPVWHLEGDVIELGCRAGGAGVSDAMREPLYDSPAEYFAHGNRGTDAFISYMRAHCRMRRLAEDNVMRRRASSWARESCFSFTPVPPAQIGPEKRNLSVKYKL